MALSKAQMDSKPNRFFSFIAWIVAGSLVLVAAYLAWDTYTSRANALAANANPSQVEPTRAKPAQLDLVEVSIPNFAPEYEI